jgi:microcystin-dependent protein
VTRALDPFLGELRAFGCQYAPQGWAHCDGQLLPISQNTGLFALLRTRYGGDGKSTFALPDLRGRTAIHRGQGLGLSDRAIGESEGSEAVTLLASEMPSHTHSVAGTETMNSKNAANNVPAAGGAYGAPPADAADPATVQPAGGDLPHNNMPPFVVTNWCIAITGVFPSA